MRLTEKKREILNAINREMKKIYTSEDYGEYSCYMNKNGLRFKIFGFSKPELIFGIEYASNTDEAQKGIFEDGDVFYLSDYQALDDMIKDMCLEIDNE